MSHQINWDHYLKGTSSSCRSTSQETATFAVFPEGFGRGTGDMAVLTRVGDIEDEEGWLIKLCVNFEALLELSTGASHASCEILGTAVVLTRSEVPGLSPARRLDWMDLHG